MSIKLNCLACGHTLTLGDAYEDFTGEVHCWGCHTLLEIALVDGRLRSIRRAGTGGAALAAPAHEQPAEPQAPLPRDGEAGYGE
jgi:hypothetical protein